MTHSQDSSKNLSYCKVGVDRTRRERTRTSTQLKISEDSKNYQFGTVIQLPFGTLYPAPGNPESYLDLQLEGVGTKTLLAELSGKYSSVGKDAVAMAVNDVIRSGATPLLVSDAIHISKSEPEKVRELISGVRAAAKEAGGVLVSGETGDVTEILHPPIQKSSPPFDLFVSCIGTVNRSKIITGMVSPGDRVIGFRSAGIHSNGLTLARKVLLKPWGGKFNPGDIPEELDRSILSELLVPTVIYAKDIENIAKNVPIKAAVHITGDGFSKFHRLLKWITNSQGLGFTFYLNRKPPPIFDLIRKTAKAMYQPIALKEMYKTFNMGYGFAIVVSKENASIAIDSLRGKIIVDDIGFVSDDGIISIGSPNGEKPILL
ncbi:MAG: AIR synthase related protein [Nitrososphaerales archaeon]